VVPPRVVIGLAPLPPRKAPQGSTSHTVDDRHDAPCSAAHWLVSTGSTLANPEANGGGASSGRIRGREVPVSTSAGINEPQTGSLNPGSWIARYVLDADGGSLIGGVNLKEAEIRYASINSARGTLVRDPADILFAWHR
jgi:hypothetical protein